MSNQEKHFYEFGPFRLDPVKRRLLRDGEPVLLTPKAFDTLLELVRQSGRSIEKDDLMKKVWPDAIVEENNLNQNISTLRKSLGDSRLESHYIATIPGFGYRFVAEVKKAPFAEPELVAEGRGPSPLLIEGGPEAGETLQLEKTEEPEIDAERGNPVLSLGANLDPFERAEARPGSNSDEPVSDSLKRFRRAAVLGLLMIGVAGLSIWVYQKVTSGPAESGSGASEIEVTPLSRTGTIGIAAISRDGRHIAYSVREIGRESLWLRQVASSSAQQILPPAEVFYQGLTFSPDGNQVNFIQAEVNGPSRTLYRMPALGGVPTKLIGDIDSVMSLSPDGSRMAFIRQSGDESLLLIADADGSNQRELARRPRSDYFKIPAWSPDGREIACSTGSGEPYDIHNSIVAVRLEDGSQRPLTAKKWAWTRWVEWLADGKGLLITARERHSTPDQIWHISATGAARRLTSDSKFYFSISLTADSRTLLAVQTELLSDIWIAQDRELNQAQKITFGTGNFDNVCFTPDGRIVYPSQASGKMDIWMMNADGSNQKQLTAEAEVNLHQSVTADGKYIVFASNRAGVFNIWRMNMDGSNPLQLTRGRGEKFPHCSPDGKWVVYNCLDCDQSHHSLWKIAIEGGEPVQLTEADANHPAVSPDGKQIAYFTRAGSPNGRFKMAVMRFSGGRPEKLFEIDKSLDPLPFVHWHPGGKALTFSASRNGVCNIWMQPLDGSAARQISNFKIDGKLQFDWSADGRQLAFSRRFWTADLALLKNLLPGKP
jgi:eukaryotic-like serine/threonine-protein kinase